jgi:hypothetical protein
VKVIGGGFQITKRDRLRDLPPCCLGHELAEHLNSHAVDGEIDPGAETETCRRQHEEGTMTEPPKVTLHNANATVEMPSQQIARKSAVTATETDVRGRKITVQKPGALELYDLACLMDKNASNEVAMNLAMAARAVVEIDGEQCPPIMNEVQLRSMLQRLDTDGINAAAKALGSLTREAPGTEAAKN